MKKLIVIEMTIIMMLWTMIDINLSNSGNNTKSSKPKNNNAISNIKIKGSNITKKSKAENIKQKRFSS
jgi:hypothetical protein